MNETGKPLDQAVPPAAETGALLKDGAGRDHQS